MTRSSLTIPSTILSAWRSALALACWCVCSLASADEPHRSPNDLVLSPDESWLVSANHTARSLSLVRLADGAVVHELEIGDRPANLALLSDGRTLLATTQFSGELVKLNVSGEKLEKVASLSLSFEPQGIAATRDGKTAYVALSSASAVAVIDVEQMTEVQRIPVGLWPRTLALSPDETRLAVSASGDRGAAVVDTAKREMLYQEDFNALNVGQMQVTKDNKFVYMPWMIYRHNPIDARNIRLGWVLASRFARMKLDGPARREALSLDPPGEAISDPWGLAITQDEEWIIVSGSGTHELLVYHLPDLPLGKFNGQGDHLDRELQRDRSKFYRFDVGGRPLNLRLSQDDSKIYVANYLLDAIQEVDFRKGKVLRTFALGGPKETSLARKGEEIFYDGRRSLDQWYSCHTCHTDGFGVAGITIDTHNDGSERTFKTVLSLRNVSRTAPWTWHGWQKGLDDAMHTSMTETMLGPRPTPADRRAVIAYLEALDAPPNPHRTPTGELTAAAQRGKLVFEGSAAACASCHKGDYFTDNEIHDVGTNKPRDAYEGYNTPSLIGVFNREKQLLHDGRAESFEQLLTGPHNPKKVAGERELTAEELKDLIEYLKSL